MSKLLTELEHVYKHNPKANFFVIVDTGKGEHYYSELLKHKIPAYSLFENTLEQDYQNIAPWLISLDALSIEDKPFIDWLEKINTENQAVTWVFGNITLKLSSLKQHLQNMLNWTIPSQEVALIRFYDQRVLPRFIDVLTDEQKVYFFGEVTSFGIFKGERFTLIKRPATEIQSAIQQNALSEKQLKILNLPERESYLKALLLELQENSNHAAVYHMDEKQTLSRMREGWDAAVKWGLYSLPTLSEWCAMSILVPQFYTHAGVKESVAGAKNERNADLNARDIMSLMRYDLNKLIDARGGK
jgi:Domain of unknown function (DUF4123)